MITFDVEPEEITWLSTRKEPRTRGKKSRMFTRAADCGANAKGGHGFQPGNTCAAKDGSSDDSGPDKTKNPVDTPEFKRWFGNSKVVDADGKPIVVYHGTSQKFDDPDEFDPDRGEIGTHFANNKDIASGIGNAPNQAGRGNRVYPVYLAIQNPLRMKDPGAWDYGKVTEALHDAGVSESVTTKWESDLQAAWKEHWDAPPNSRPKTFPRNQYIRELIESSGFDGVVYLNRREGVKLPKDLKEDTSKLNALSDEEFKALVPEASESWIALRREQIKSVNNRGTFDPKDPSMAKSFEAGLINMFNRALSDCGANAEGGHGFQPGNTCAKEKGGSSQEYKPVTAGATVQEGGFGGMREGFNIAAPGGARVNGYLYDADFGAKKSSKTRGELFFIEVPKDQRKKGLATSLATDAIRLMQRNGAKTVSMNPMQPGAKELNARLVANGVLGKIVDTTDTGKVEYEIIDTATDAATKELEDGSKLTIPPSHTYGEMPVEVKRDGNYVSFVYNQDGKKSDLIKLDEDAAKSFLADLRGQLPHQPNSGNAVLDSAIENKAKLLGHGQGGIVFDADDKIVKAASRVPYHWNNGLRTQQQANEKLQSEIDIVNTLQAKGIPGLLPLTSVMHEGRLFAIRDKVSLNGIDQQAIDDAGAAIEQMHASGYIMRDQVQLGMGDDGKFRFYDVGEAGTFKDDRWSNEDKQMDHSSLQRVAEKAGLKYVVPDDRDAGLKLEDAITEAYGAVEGDSVGNLITRRTQLKVAFGRLQRQKPEEAELYGDAYEELLHSIRRRHDELNPDKKGGKSIQKSIRPNALFTRSASDCGANADGGGGFQPGNTCGKDGSSDTVSKDPTDTPEFKRWFGDSRVVDADGKPMSVHHTTNAKEFSEFRTAGLSAHFGDAGAADARQEDLRDFSENVVGRDAGQFRTEEVFLKIESPLTMPDMASLYRTERGEYLQSDEVEDRLDEFYQDDPDNPEDPLPMAWESEGDVQEWLHANDIITSDEFWEVQYDIDKAVKLLQEKGYDGIKYENAVENPGSISWIPFSPNQIKSKTKNSGEFEPNSNDMTKSFLGPKTLFTCAADCGANTEGGHGFQPGNTCAGGKDKKNGDKGGKPKRPREKQKLAEAFYGTTKAGQGKATPQVKEWAEKRFNDPEKAKAFTEWFGDSKVVDENGKPLVAYHGTNAEFDEFSTTGGKDLGSHFGTTSQANDFTKDSGHIKPVYLAIKNPLRVEDPERWDFDKVKEILAEKGIEVEDSPYKPETANKAENYKRKFARQRENVAKAMAAAGYDGIVYRNKYEGDKSSDSYIVFKPTQIKSATGNQGTFDPNDANITKAFKDGLTALFTRAASDCGANAEGGHGFQPGNTCAGGEDGKKDGGEKPKSQGLKRKLAEAFYGTTQDNKKILAMVDPAHVSESEAEDPKAVTKLKEKIATPEQREHHQKVLKQVLDKMPPKMADRISKNVRDVKLCGSPEIVGVLGGKGPRHSTLYGFYRPGSRELVMDGGPDQEGNANGKNMTQAGLYAHELAHAADKIGFHRTFSETENWKQAYQSEIDNDQVPLSDYARLNRAEGFAEFVRLMVTHPDEAKTKYPKCAKAVQSAYGSF